MIAIADMPAVPGFTTPRDLYCAIAPPAPLYGMPYPLRRTAADWQALYAAGVRGVVCLDEPARYDPAPLDLAAVIDLEDMVHGGAPIDPAPGPRSRRRHRVAGRAAPRSPLRQVLLL